MMSLHARRELVAAVALRYQSATKSNKGHLLDEFIQNTSLNRKYAICLLRKAALAAAGPPQRTQPRQRRRKYGTEIERLFLSLWRMSGGLCPKRLVPFLGEFLNALERFEEITPCPNVKDKLLQMSISTAERMLSRTLRSREHGISTTLPGTLLRQQIPIRTYEDWTEGKPGFLEIDLVAHCGGTAAGEYLYTLTMTDIYTGWTECLALINRSQITVQEAIELGRKRLPFDLLGIDSDNGSEFINHHLKHYCDARQIMFTRCRPYKKNDQCHVEQKNGAVVRPLVGYARYEGIAAAKHLNRLYQVHRLSLNYFEPSLKLIGKSRVGARVKKTYDVAQTPWQRLKKSNLLSRDETERQDAKYLTLNPAKLRRDIAELEMGLRHLVPSSLPAASAPNASPMATAIDATSKATLEGGETHGTAA